MRRTLAAAVFTALSIATAGAQLTIPKEYLPKVHGTIRSKYELQTTTGMQRFQVRNARVSLDGKVLPVIAYDITHTRAITFPGNSSTLPLTTITGTSIQSYKLDIGAQYTQVFGKKHEATLGVVFSPGHDLNNDSYVEDRLGNEKTGTTVNNRDTVAAFGSPMSLGVGFSYVYDKRLTVGADFTFQKWSSVTYMNEKNAFCNRTKIAVGAEFLPNPMGRSYLAHVKYRLGAYYSQPYYKINGMRAADEYGVTAGFGLPIPRTRSVLSLSAQYVRTEGKTAAFLNENTLRICVGVTFNERWFFKRKVD